MGRVMAAPLESYRNKRSFDRTAEPRGDVRPGNGFSFVVQKHAASRLHYDFRLELDGVLLSWAVPKGPSLDPKVKRLAMQTEDHPIAYAGFEGVIPQGEYGGGTVMVWDRGRWVPEGDPHDAYARGNLKFRLEGRRLRGSWHLVRTKGRAEDRPTWLLFKGSDAEASTSRDIVAESTSVISGRDLDAIATTANHVWRSNRDADGVPAVRSPAPPPPTTTAPAPEGTPEPPKLDAATAKGARQAELAEQPFAPQLATLTSQVPAGDGWFHEIKLDGYRIVAYADGAQVRLYTRRGLDWAGHFPDITRVLAAAALPRAVLDGEMVVLDERGVSDFQALQNVLDAPRQARDVVYYAFDLLYLDGWDLRGAHLEDRKRLLHDLLARHFGADATIRYSDHVVGRGEAAYREACRLGLEGIVSKRRDSLYRGGRGSSWLKAKCSSRQEFVIAGFSDPGGAREHFGALLLGVYRDGELRYAGKTGTGFTQASLDELHAKLAPLEQRQPAFVDPPRGAEARGVHWLKPELVAEIAFAGFTADGRARQAVFHGLREDKIAREVRREVAVRPSETQAPSGPASSPPAAAASEVHGTEHVAVSHPERVVYPDCGLTKGQVAEYYRRIGALMLPHVLGRPLSLVRCPDGQAKGCFYQKHAWSGLGAGLLAVPIAEDGEIASYVAVGAPGGLVDLVQFGVLEVHVWGSRADQPEAPDRLIFDLDPAPDVGWPAVVAAAEEVRDRLAQLSLRSFVKSTGGKGLHVVVPLRRDPQRFRWEQAKAFCKAVAQSMEADSPGRYLSQATKAKRKGKIYVDYLRNARGATAIAPYSTRARSGAPVAVPLAWEELSRFDPARPLTVQTLGERLQGRGQAWTDPWRELPGVRQVLASKVLKML